MGPHIPVRMTMGYVERCDSGIGDKLGETLASKCRNNKNTSVALAGYPKDLGLDAVVGMS